MAVVTGNLRYLSAYNGFQPEITAQVVASCRDENKFKLNRYIQYVPTALPQGQYCAMGRDEFVRVVSDQESAWKDGDFRPFNRTTQLPFVMMPFTTFRRDYSWVLGYGAINNTTVFKPKVAYMRMAISKAMTNRTNRVITLLLNTANWGTNYGNVFSLTGINAVWAAGSDDPNNSNYNLIFKTLVQPARNINLATNAVVEPTDLRVVIGPDLAIAIAESAELNNYVRECTDSVRLLEGGWDPQYDMWGIPKRYKGFEFVVENAPLVNVRPSQANFSATLPLQPAEDSASRSYIMPKTSAVVLSRPYGLDGELGFPSYSTCQIFHHGGLLQVKVFDDPKHELVDGHVEEDIHEQVVSNVSGYLIQATA
jgi:hypothetical protein